MNKLNNPVESIVMVPICLLSEYWSPQVAAPATYSALATRWRHAAATSRTNRPSSRPRLRRCWPRARPSLVMIHTNAYLAPLIWPTRAPQIRKITCAAIYRLARARPSKVPRATAAFRTATTTSQVGNTSHTTFAPFLQLHHPPNKKSPCLYSFSHLGLFFIGLHLCWRSSCQSRFVGLTCVVVMLLFTGIGSSGFWEFSFFLHAEFSLELCLGVSWMVLR